MKTSNYDGDEPEPDGDTVNEVENFLVTNSVKSLERQRDVDADVLVTNFAKVDLVPPAVSPRTIEKAVLDPNIANSADLDVASLASLRDAKTDVGTDSVAANFVDVPPAVSPRKIENAVLDTNIANSADLDVASLASLRDAKTDVGTDSVAANFVDVPPAVSPRKIEKAVLDTNIAKPADLVHVTSLTSPQNIKANVVTHSVANFVDVAPVVSPRRTDTDVTSSPKPADFIENASVTNPGEGETDVIITSPPMPVDFVGVSSVVSPEEISIRTVDPIERWSDSLISLPLETVASDFELAAQCEISEMYYTASSEVSLLSNTEAAERANVDEDSLEEREAKDDRKECVIAGHVAAMRERFESMTRTNTPCPDLMRSTSPSLDVFGNITPSPDHPIRLG